MDSSLWLENTFIPMLTFYSLNTWVPELPPTLQTWSNIWGMSQLAPGHTQRLSREQICSMSTSLLYASSQGSAGQHKETEFQSVLPGRALWGCTSSPSSPLHPPAFLEPPHSQAPWLLHRAVSDPATPSSPPQSKAGTALILLPGMGSGTIATPGMCNSADRGDVGPS